MNVKFMHHFLYHSLVILLQIVWLHCQELINLCNSYRDGCAGIWTSNHPVYIVITDQQQLCLSTTTLERMEKWSYILTHYQSDR